MNNRAYRALQKHSELFQLLRHQKIQRSLNIYNIYAYSKPMGRQGAHEPQLGLIQSLPLHAGSGSSLVIASQSYLYFSQNSLSASLKNRLSIMSFTRQMKIVPAAVRNKIKMGYRSHKIKGFSVT